MARFFSPSLNLRFLRYLVDVMPTRPVASTRYLKAMVPELPSLADQFAATGRPELATLPPSGNSPS